MSTPNTGSHNGRPSLFEYESIAPFITDMLEWLRQSEQQFSVSAMVKTLPGCSRSLVTRVANGSRRLTRDRVEDFATLLRLTRQEKKFLDQWVAADRKVETTYKIPPSQANADSTKLLRPNNQLLSNWVNVYVKDACRLKGFKPDPVRIYRLLGGIASVNQIKSSLEFLFREGFLRKTLNGSVVENNLIDYTTDDIADHRIARFHKRALEIAKRGIDLFPIGVRRASTYVLAIDKEHLDEVHNILSECMEKLLQFEQNRPNENEKLYQVIVNLTPLGGSHETAS